MIRKAIKVTFLTGAVLGGTGFLLFGTDLGSYLGTVASSVKEGVEGQIPVDFEIKRAEKLIREIDPQVETCKRDVARAEVELDELQHSVVVLQKVVGSEEAKLRNGAKLLGDDPDGKCSLAGDVASRRRVERDLQRTLDSFRNNSSILKTKQTLIERQAEAVEVAKQRLTAVRAEKENLADQVRALKTQKQWIEAMAAGQHRFDLDDSALSQAKEALAKVKKRLDVAQKMLENEVVFHGDDGVAVGEPSRDVLREIQQQFSGADAEELTVIVDPSALSHR